MKISCIEVDRNEKILQVIKGDALRLGENLGIKKIDLFGVEFIIGSHEPFSCLSDHV